MQILFCNNDIVVCIKPVGLDSEKQLPDALSNEIGGEIFTLHRLDKNVGGVMVYARSSKVASELSRSILDGSMIKEYLALVHGQPNEEGVLEDFLFKDSSKNKVYVVKRERKGVKKAKLEYKLIFGGETSLVHIRLHTGRSHQIRVQFASRGHSLIGDHKYGAKDDVEFPMLYSYRITFPYKNEILSFEALPQWAEGFIEKIKA